MGRGKKNPSEAGRADKAAAGKIEASGEKWSDVEVEVSPEAQEQFDQLPLPIQRRARDVFIRLRKWPAVSGAKPLKGEYSGSYRIRTGDYRIVFRPAGDTKISIWKIGNRKDVYLD